MAIFDLLPLHDETRHFGEADLRAAPVDLKMKSRKRIIGGHKYLLRKVANQDTAILCEKRRMMNSAGRTAAMPISTIMRPSRMSSAVIVLPRPTAT